MDKQKFLAQLLVRTRRVGACLLWTGAKNSNGYPTVKRRAISSSPLYVHRVVCEIVHGPIPEGMHAMHSSECVSRLCIEPTHIKPGTKSENNLERYARDPRRGEGGRWAREEKRQRMHLDSL